MFHTEDPQILGSIVQYLVAMRPGDRDFYTAVVACPPNTHIYTEDYTQIIFFPRTQYGTTDLYHYM